MTSRHVIVAGFHRSGTSMTAQVLGRAGLPLGDTLLLPNAFNQDGFFEDADIVEAHDDLLADAGHDWQYAEDDLPPVPGHRLANLRRIAAERDHRHAVWGFKDPRVCLFLEVWREVLDDPVVLVVYRDPSTAAASLRNRAAREVVMMPPAPEAVRFWSDPALASRMWLRHNRALVDYAVAHPERSVVVDQDAILAGFPLVQTLNERFRLGLDASASTGIRADVQGRFGAVPPGSPRELEAEIEDTWATLNRLASHTTFPTVAPVPRPSEPGASVPLVQPAPRGAARRYSDVSGAAEPDAVVAIAEEARAQATRPEGLQFAVELGRCLAARGAHREAEETLLAAMDLHPGAPAPAIVLVTSMFRQGRFGEAVELASEAARRAPESFPAQMILVHALHRYGQLAAALEVGDVVRGRFPDNLAIHEILAGLLLQLGRPEEADVSTSRAAASVVDQDGYARRLVSAVESVPDPVQRADLEERTGRHLELMRTAAVHATLSGEPRSPAETGTT
ncbi:tetratricopeptide repeat protein [Promicromonospora panici]|uniref:tetratricopeptide repeat protein n=1 Tax=Promicromonospora panici TaxID=2219658 RepID=UPI00101BDC91|nr:tetratricopeptide repeat protein [Promicromonospora panici]